MALNWCELWSKGIKIAFFSEKLQKIVQRLRALTQTLIISVWEIRPQTPVCDTFELH